VLSVLSSLITWSNACTSCRVSKAVRFDSPSTRVRRSWEYERSSRTTNCWNDEELQQAIKIFCE
jgi:hypothetical protein